MLKERLRLLAFPAFVGGVIGYFLGRLIYQILERLIESGDLGVDNPWYGVIGAIAGAISFPLIIARTHGDGPMPVLGWIYTIFSLYGALAYCKYDLNSAYLVLLVWMIHVFLVRILYIGMFRKTKKTKVLKKTRF